MIKFYKNHDLNEITIKKNRFSQIRRLRNPHNLYRNKIVYIETKKPLCAIHSYIRINPELPKRKSPTKCAQTKKSQNGTIFREFPHKHTENSQTRNRRTHASHTGRFPIDKTQPRGDQNPEKHKKPKIN